MHRAIRLFISTLCFALVTISIEARAIVIITPPPPDTPPTVTTTQVSSTLVATGSTVIFDATFTDPDAGQSFTALIDWGDGTISPGTVTLTAIGTYSVTGQHSYTVPGVYTITVAVSDGQLAGGAESEYVVVFNPQEGFVTGGGWFDSPAGAYTYDSAMTGRANFGFVAKYLKGANVPIGSTEFNFQTARLNFHSNNYEWLVVAGAKAMYKGSGTINQQGDYTFMLTATDGQAPGGGGADRIRIRIWDANGIVYDNQGGAAFDADPTQLINGSIVIHK